MLIAILLQEKRMKLKGIVLLIFFSFLSFGANMKRIMIFGRSGSGKSTFAVKLHKRFNFPLYHIDKFGYTKGWVERDHQEFLTMLQQFVEQDTWIIDGNGTDSLEMRYQRADICLYFNYPRRVCLLRSLKRFFYKDRTIKDRAEDCPEKFDWPFIKYIWTFDQRVKDTVASIRHNYPGVKFIEVTNDKQLRAIEKELF